MNTTQLDTTLESAGRNIRSLTGLSDEIVAANAGRNADDDIVLGATLDADYSLSILSGKGEYKHSTYPGGATFNGHFEITAPDNGTWTIHAKVAGKTIVDKSDVAMGHKISFKAETHFSSNTTVEIKATWSEPGNTDLNIHVHAKY